ncbi:uncharacterized protein LOC144134443 [Amblyomma americanum]
MVETRIFSVLLFPFLLTAVFANGKDEEKQQPTADIEKFLKENPKMWVYNTTEPSNITCRLDVYTNVTVNSTSFSRYFVDNTREEKKLNLTGNFLDWQGGVPPLPGKFDAMEISYRERKFA